MVHASIPLQRIFYRCTIARRLTFPFLRLGICGDIYGRYAVAMNSCRSVDDLSMAYILVDVTKFC